MFNNSLRDHKTTVSKVGNFLRYSTSKKGEFKLSRYNLNSPKVNFFLFVVNFSAVAKDKNNLIEIASHFSWDAVAGKYCKILTIKKNVK
jgi:hypothetical protein